MYLGLREIGQKRFISQRNLDFKFCLSVRGAWLAIRICSVLASCVRHLHGCYASLVKHLPCVCVATIATLQVVFYQIQLYSTSYRYRSSSSTGDRFTGELFSNP